MDADAGEIVLIAEARTTGPTGVEMEALTAASVAALTVYDMVKGLERGAEIARGRAAREVGRSVGEWPWTRQATEPAAGASRTVELVGDQRRRRRQQQVEGAVGDHRRERRAPAGAAPSRARRSSGTR